MLSASTSTSMLKFYFISFILIQTTWHIEHAHTEKQKKQTTKREKKYTRVQWHWHA